MCCGLLSESIQDVLRMDEVRRSHLVVIKLILKKGRTNVHIEIREYNGGIKITGLLYLLGLGLGTFFIYKYCSRISPYIYHSFFSSPTFLSPLFSNHQASSSVDVTNLQSPDSGVCSDQKGGGVANNPPLNESTVKVLDWFKKGDFSKDEDDEDMKKMMMMSGFSSGYMSGTTENVDLSSSKGLKKDDGGVRRPSVSHVFRRNCRSYASLKSNDSSLYNYRESLLSKGFSVDLGETLDDVISPYNHALQLDFRGLRGDVVVGCDGGEGGLEEELQGVLDQLKTDLHSMTLQLSRLNKVDNDGDDDDVFDGGDFIDDYSFFPLDDHHHMNHENNNNNHANNNNNNHVNHNLANNNHGDNDVNKDGDHANRSNENINRVNNNKAFSKHCNKDIKSRNKIIFKYRIEEEEEEEEDDDAGKLPSCEVPAGFGAYESCNNNNNNKRNNSNNNNNNDEEEEEEEYMWDYRSDLVTSSKRFVSLRPCHNNNNNNNNDTNNNNNSNNKLRSEENNDKEFVKSPQNDFEVDSLKGEDSRPDDDDEDEDDLVDNKRLKLFSNEMTQPTNGGLHDFSDDGDDEGDDVVMFFLDDGIDTCWRNGGGRSKGRSKLAVKGRSLRREPIRSLGGQVVGPVKGLHEHLETDLKVDLLISSHIRKAYSSISSKFNITNVRCISSVMHASFLPLTYLSIIHPSPSIIKITSNFQTTVQNLIISIDTQHEYLKEWSISGRHNILFKLISSLKTFSQQTSIVSSISEESHKHSYLSTLLNQHNYIEESLVHGFKVALILINIQLQKCNPRDFFNSINNVNGPFTPDQLQMISDVSSYDITIIRPSMFLHPSFISSYSPSSSLVSSSLALPSSSSPHPQQSSSSSHPQSQPSSPSSSSSHPPPPSSSHPPPPSSSHPPPSSPLSPNEAPSQPPTPVFTIIEEEMGAMHCVPSN